MMLSNAQRTNIYTDINVISALYHKVWVVSIYVTIFLSHLFKIFARGRLFCDFYGNIYFVLDITSRKVSVFKRYPFLEKAFGECRTVSF